MTLPARTLPPMEGGDPYTEEGQRLAVAPHQVNEHALALRSKLGKLLLTGSSEFKVIAAAAGVPAERLVLELIAVARKKPEILECTEDSIMTFMFDAAKLGLMIGRGVFPVPVNHGQGRDREKRLEAWVGYKGSKELAMQSRAIRDVWAEVHFEGDTFEFERAPVPRVKLHGAGIHFGDMKKALGAYATILLPGTGNVTRSKYLTRDEIEALRSKNRGNTTASSSPWVTSTKDMWMAKAILQITKDLPQNPRLAYLQALDERSEGPAGLDPAQEVQPAAAERVEDPEETPVDEAREPEPMPLGVASVIGVRMQGGAIRMLSEMRNTGLEAVRTWARAGLERDPDSASLQRIAEGCTVVLDARAAGTAKEPPKREGN